MEENITINLQACRFCLKVSEDKMTEITANIKINFENLINEEVSYIALVKTILARS